MENFINLNLDRLFAAHAARGPQSCARWRSITRTREWRPRRASRRRVTYHGWCACAVEMPAL